jgi:CPA1 family monovalent cation:H+ antiporter
VGRELSAARERALRAALEQLAADRSPAAELVRQEFTSRLVHDRQDSEPRAAVRSEYDDLRRRALQAARRAVLALRTRNEIGDDAFHQMEEELDWLEMADGGRE